MYQTQPLSPLDICNLNKNETLDSKNQNASLGPQSTSRIIASSTLSKREREPHSPPEPSKTTKIQSNFTQSQSTNNDTSKSESKSHQCKCTPLLKPDNDAAENSDCSLMSELSDDEASYKDNLNSIQDGSVKAELEKLWKVVKENNLPRRAPGF
jgi:hypothetical protein